MRGLKVSCDDWGKVVLLGEAEIKKWAMLAAADKGADARIWFGAGGRIRGSRPVSTVQGSDGGMAAMGPNKFSDNRHQTMENQLWLKEEKMKQYLRFVVGLGFLSAGCGGGAPAVESPSQATKNAAEPTGGTETDQSGEAEAVPETSLDESAEARPQESPAPPPANNDNIKEAGEARITDKNIVISGKVLFETGNAKLKKVSFAVLDEVVFAMEKHPEIVKLQVVGHTDSDGDAKANKLLSKKRATAVMKYLIKNGIGKDRLSALGEGEERPIASNDTEEGKDTNRRVEFNIVERARVKATTHSSSTVAPGKVNSRNATDDETEELIKKERLDKKF